MEEGSWGSKAVWGPGKFNWVLQTGVGLLAVEVLALLPTPLDHKGGSLPVLFFGARSPLSLLPVANRAQNKECIDLGTKFTFSAICKSLASLLSCSLP